MYVENTDGKYDEYIAAYKALTIDVAQLMAYENGGNGPSIDELESFWINLFQIESTIAKVLVILFLLNNVTYYEFHSGAISNNFNNTPYFQGLL